MEIYQVSKPFTVLTAHVHVFNNGIVNNLPDDLQWFDCWLLFLPHPWLLLTALCSILANVSKNQYQVLSQPLQISLLSMWFLLCLQGRFTNPFIMWKERALFPPEGLVAWVHHCISCLQVPGSVRFHSLGCHCPPPKDRCSANPMNVSSLEIGSEQMLVKVRWGHEVVSVPLIQCAP